MEVWDLEGCPVCGRQTRCSYLAGGDCSFVDTEEPFDVEAKKESKAAERVTAAAERFAPWLAASAGGA